MAQQTSSRKALLHHHLVLSERRQALRMKADQEFSDMSVPAGTYGDQDCLLEDDIYDYLEEVLDVEAEKLPREAIQLLLDTAHRMQDKEGLIPQEDKGPGELALLAREALIPALVKYGEFIKQFDKKGQEDAFSKYDKQQDGQLSRRELRILLQDYERRATRTKNGFIVTLMIHSSDLDWIIAQVDEDGNGEINRAEFLPAIAAWEELAEARLQQPRELCVIL
jgi:EF-hand domain pair